MNKIREVKIGLAISIFILLTILYVVFALNKKDRDSTLRAVHSARIIMKLEDISSAVHELEGLQRGYLLTHHPEFIPRYSALTTQLVQDLAILHKIVSHNPVQLANAQELEQLMKKELLVLKTRMDSPVSDTHELVTVTMVMSGAIAKLSVMKDLEEMLMKKRLADSREWFKQSTISVVISVITAAFLIVTAYLILIREYRQKVVAEQKLLSFQQLLKEKIEKLDVSNKELEQFAYIASHDLQEPLRKIITFNERIRHKFTDSISPEMKDYLDRVSGAAGRMRILIDELLAYSRVSKKELKRTDTDLEQVISVIKDNCEVLIQNRQVRFVQHHPLPVILADRTQMIQLFQNLVSNAIKFTPPDVSPVIEFSCSVVGREALSEEPVAPAYDQYDKICVKDNGIGFEETYFEKIFVIFQRLHGRSEYEGSGIGLSICKKIVENHEGYIKAWSEHGKGAEFSVFMPRIT
jgi:signal transduction histidine kinase